MTRRQRRVAQGYVKKSPPAGYVLSALAVLVTLAFVLFVFTPWKSSEERKNEGVNRILNKVNATAEQDDEPENDAEKRLVTQDFRFFGSEGYVRVASSKLLSTHQKETELIGKLRELERMLDTADPQSEASLLQKHAGQKPVAVSETLFEALQACKTAYETFDGAVDCTLGPVRDHWSFGRKQPRIALRDELAKALVLVDGKSLILDETAKTAFLTEAGMKLDFHALRNGLAFRLADRLLTEAGYGDFLLFIGNDAFVRGDRGGTGWSIKLYHPRRAWKSFGTLAPSRRTMSVTGDYEHMFETKRRRIHPTLDPKTGQPTETLQQITVQADDPILAQAFGTAAFVNGADWAFDKAKALANVDFVLHDKDGMMRMTEGMKALLTLEDENAKPPTVPAEKEDAVEKSPTMPEQPNHDAPPAPPTQETPEP